ncbi:MAG: metallophosphoesterase [Chryseolinea sp.]
MGTRVMTLLFFSILFLAIDYYVFQGVLVASENLNASWRNALRYAFWIPTIISLVALAWWAFDDPYRYSPAVRMWVMAGLVAVYFSKIFAVVILFIDDLTRGVRWAAGFFAKGSTGDSPGQSIPRSEFLSKTALIVSSVPFGAMAYGVISGAHDYRVRRISIKLPNLPRTFDGIRIGQLSDIHTGSFYNKTAVKGGIEMLMREKPEIILFTGDLVNNEASELTEYFDVFNKLKAPYGVFSVTGNHDYGDYHQWSSMRAKAENFKDLVEAHRLLGYNLLMNEHKLIEIDKESIAILGNENWGGGRFAKYGKLDQAYSGSRDAPVKILLSHDPSHWDAQVRPLYPDIDLMFSGHTHGFQFGVEIGNVKWSPSQYAYKQWAGLYQQGSQYLYVNRGFGYLGYPGRIGMPPELTIIELRRA